MTWDLTSAKARLGITDSSQDVALQSAMDVALAVAESYCDRRFLKQDDTQEFISPIRATLLVRRWPLDKLISLMPLEPLPEPPPEPVAIPATWRLDKKRGMVFIVGMPPWITPVGITPPAAFPWSSQGRLGFVLAYTGGYDPLPADLEAALWMVFDNVWATTPGWGMPAGSSGGGSGAVRSFAIDGMSITYDTSTAAGSVGAGRAEGYGLMPASAVGILDFYRAESAALGG